jgi:hypothetical protein
MGILGMIAKVRVHATLSKRRVTVARCSLEDGQPFRILEVPLWMFNIGVVRKNALRCGINNLECTRDNVTVVRLACCARDFAAYRSLALGLISH